MCGVQCVSLARPHPPQLPLVRQDEYRCVPTAGDADPRWMSAVREAGQGERERERERVRGGGRLFRATQRRLSLEEMETLALHSAAAEEIGEDFFGNFS